MTRRSARVAAALATALALMPAVAGGRAAAQTAPPATVEPAPGTTALTYRLADDWFDVAYTGDLARIRTPVDVSSGPDGTVFVLDYEGIHHVPDFGQSDPYAALLHAIDPNSGMERQVIDLAPWVYGPTRLDAASDGSIAILGRSTQTPGTTARVVKLDAGGRWLGAWDLANISYGTDIAALPDGRIAVAIYAGFAVIDPTSPVIARIALTDLGINPVASGHRYNPRRLDAGLDGRVTALVGDSWACPQPTSPPRTPPTPYPTPTPRPSFAAAGGSSARVRRAVPEQSEGVCAAEIAITLRPDLTLESALGLPEYYEDIAVRDGAVFVPFRYRSGDVLRVGAVDGKGPEVGYPLARVMPDGVARSSGGVSGVAIDVAPDGTIIAVWANSEFFTNGPVRLGVPGDKGAVATGMAYGDRPALTGPVRPRAVSAGPDGLAVLEGAYALAGAAPRTRRTVDIVAWSNAIQRWTFDGRLVGQWAHAGGSSWVRGSHVSDGGAPEDIAVVGNRTYTATPGGIWLRTSMIEPAWFSGVPGIRLVAADADETAVVAFDAAGSQVIVWAPDGRQIAAWAVKADGRAVAASDLTVGGGRVYIADTGRNRVLVRSMSGDDLGEWRTHDGPQRLDMTDDGDIVVLGRGGWGLRYTPDGGLRAAWRMPGSSGVKRLDGTDITAGLDGSVYVSYSRVTVGSAVDRSQDGIEAAGIWRFEMSVPPPDSSPPSPDPQHCLVDVEKVASPARVSLGAPVSIALTAQGECPKEPLPEQILFVLDTSWSMNDGYAYPSQPPGALERARRVLVPLLGALDPSVVDVGLVTFGDGAALQTVLSDDIADLRSRILRAQADGDTRMGAGVDLAHGELNGPRRVVDARRAIVIVSDGVFKDDPRAAIAAARADDIDVHALIVTTPEFTPEVRASLVAMLGADHLDIDPSPDRAKAIIDAIGAWRTEPDVFDTLTVRDVVPANMRYVVGSAVPAAAWDAVTRTLTWVLAPRPAGMRVTLRYAVVPEEAGTWPTNVEADATWRDVRGGTGALRFPVPHVDVVTGTRIFLPFATRTVCARWTRPIDLVLLQDISSSMRERAADGQRTKLAVAVDAASLFLDRLNSFRDRVAIVAFDADARVVVPLSNDFGAASAGLTSLRAGYGTRIDRGLSVATTVLSENSRALALPVVVLLSDGLQNGSADPVRAALPELRAIGARVFVVGYGQTVDEALLREIAGDPADYRYAPAVEDLRAVYDAVGRTLLCP
ncbi:MAG: VWA domain-containing protein [Ardenticatenales bacterium]